MPKDEPRTFAEQLETVMDQINSTEEVEAKADGEEVAEVEDEIVAEGVEATDEPTDGEVLEAEGAEKAEKPAAEEKPVIEAKEEDPLSIPEDIKGRTRERMEGFVSTIKEKDTALAERDEAIGSFRKMIEDTGLENAEFVSALDMMKAVKSGDPKVIPQLQTIIANIAKHNGVEAPGVDLLEDFPDLKKAATEEFSITPEHAVELANARRAKAREESTRQRQQTVEKQTTDFEGEKRAAIADVERVLLDMQKGLDFEVKSPHLLEAARWAAENLPPKKWTSYLINEDQRLSKMAKTLNANKRTVAPLSHTNSKGGEKVPQTIEDLVNQY